jgi:hypothetical protein
VHILLQAGGPAILVNHLILRSPCQEGDKMARIFELCGRVSHPTEKTSPNTLEKIKRVESRPKQARQLPPDDEPYLRLILLEQLPGRLLITSLNPLEKIGEIILLAQRPIADRHFMPPRVDQVRLFLVLVSSLKSSAGLAMLDTLTHSLTQTEEGCQDALHDPYLDRPYNNV